MPWSTREFAAREHGPRTPQDVPDGDPAHDDRTMVIDPVPLHRTNPQLLQ